MKGSAIRHLASSSHAPLVAAALFEKTVQIWNLQTSQKTAQFETVLDFGGTRLAMSGNGKRCVAASWRAGARGGVACYDTTAGKKLWHRTDLSQTQDVIASADQKTLWWVPDTGRIQRLDLTTGRTVQALRGFRWIADSPHSSALFLARRRGNHVLRHGRDISVPQFGFAVLDAAFGPDTLCISEAAGPLRCLSLSGHEKWRYAPTSGSGVNSIWYADFSFYGIEYYESGKPEALIQLRLDTGARKVLTKLHTWEETFCASLALILTASGEVYDLSGRLKRRLNFPKTDYAD